MQMLNKAVIDIWYLYHSGFALKVREKLLVFDYYCDKAEGYPAGLSTGVVGAGDIKNKEVFVFSSHSHSDHFNSVVLQWVKHAKKITYIFSDDIVLDNPVNNVVFTHPSKEYTINDMKITTFNSTDIGTAFLVQIDGYKIFHAGDLNWWHWNGEPDNDNIAMGEKYKTEINKMKGEEIDIAFIPVDPRLEEHYILGLNYFMSKIGAKAVFPMHFADDFSVFGRLMHDKRTEAYHNYIKVIARRGQHFTF